MTPNFALSLAFDGIRLLHRVPGGWHLVGEVPIDAPNIAQELAVLRRTALSLDPKGLRTKVLIPNDQIKYMALDGTRATDDDIHRTLHGATPYDLSDLVIDNSRGGGRTYIAAVPKETLDEAEAFAVENKFSPVCFAAVPEPFTYQGEVFFGRTKAADTLLKPDERVSRDLDPVKIIGAVHLPKPEVIAEPDPKPEPQPEPETAEKAVPADVETKPEPEPEPVAEVPPVEDVVADTADDTPVPDLPDAVAEAEPAPSVRQEEPQDEPLKDSGAEAAVPDAPAPAESLAPEAEAPPEPEATVADDIPAPAPDDAAAPPADLLPSTTETPEPAPKADPEPAPELEMPKTEPEVVFASRSRTLRADDDIAPPSVRPAPSAPVRQSASEPGFTSRHRNGSGNATPARKDPPVLAVPTDPGTPTPVAPALTRTDPAHNLSAPMPAVTSAPPEVTEAPPPITGRPADAMPESLVNLGAAAPLSGLSAQDLIMAPAPTAQSVASPAPADIGAPPTVTPPPAEPAKPKSTGLFRSRRQEGKRPTAPEPAPAEEEANRLTVFGARKTAKQAAVGGKPRFLLLILMLILLLAMAAIAMMASRTEGGLAALLGIDGAVTEPTQLASADPPEFVVVPVAIAPTDDATDAQPAPEAQAPPPDTAQTDPPEAAPADTSAAIDAMAAALAAATADQPTQEQTNAPGSQATVDTAVSDAGAVLLSPAEAQRLYDATGVWQRAARLPIIPRTEAAPSVNVTAADGQAKAPLAQPALPDAGATAPDPVLAAQIAPPGPGVVFERDDRGFIKATPEGTVLPDGLVVYAGAPPVRPAPRPGSAPPAPQVDLTTEDPAAPLDPTSPEIAAETAEPAPEETVIAALVDGPRPRPRPDTLAPPTPEAAPETAPDPALGRIRPRLRPDGIAPPAPVAAPEPEAAPDPAPGQAAAAAAAAASTVDVAAIADAIAASVPPDPTAGATRAAPAASGRPDVRPRNFDRVVQAARRAPAPEVAAQPATEPTVARNATVAPSGPVPGGVARAATEENVINLRSIALLGVRGSSSDRVAIVRQPNGRILSVKVGDNLDGGRVTAIGEHALNYVKRGRTYTLEIGA